VEAIPFSKTSSTNALEASLMASEATSSSKRTFCWNAFSSARAALFACETEYLLSCKPAERKCLSTSRELHRASGALQVNSLVGCLQLCKAAPLACRCAQSKDSAITSCGGCMPKLAMLQQPGAVY